LGLFDQVVCLNDRNLDDLVDGFTVRHAQLIQHSERGFGLWLWKPAILMELLAVKRPRVVVYLDAGCDIGTSPAARAAWEEMLGRTSATGISVFECEAPGATEIAYTKADLLELLRVAPDDRLSRQAMGGALAISNSGQAVSLVARWLEIATRDDYHFLDDSPSIREEDAAFVAHRHDQSVLSCLCKTSGVSLLPNPEAVVPGALADRPFLTARNRGFTSTANQGLLARSERVVIRRLVSMKQAVRG